MIVEDFATYFADLGQAATLAGVAVVGILDVDSLDEFSAITQRTTFLLQPTTAVGAQQGQALVVGGITYTVRQVISEPPDGQLKRLVLARV